MRLYSAVDRLKSMIENITGWSCIGTPYNEIFRRESVPETREHAFLRVGIQPRSAHVEQHVYMTQRRKKWLDQHGDLGGLCSVWTAMMALWLCYFDKNDVEEIQRDVWNTFIIAHQVQGSRQKVTEISAEDWPLAHEIAKRGIDNAVRVFSRNIANLAKRVLKDDYDPAKGFCCEIEGQYWDIHGKPMTEEMED